MQTNYGWILLLFLSISANSQIIISGNIRDNYGIPVQEVRITAQNASVYSDAEGNYSLPIPNPGKTTVRLEKEGFQTLEARLELNSSQVRNFILTEEIYELSETIIQHSHEKKIQNAETVNAQFLKEEFSGSLAKSLEKIPGIQAMEIGSGTSKPVIRGLGFNRISVVDNGIKQEGQQWGADHGLEINPWSIENVEIIKGAHTLEYGSDAMGGVISIKNNKKPLPYSFKGELNLMGRSANQALGSSFNLAQRGESFYYKLSGNYTDFGDYSVPTDQIVYLSRNIPIFNQRLKNTAGRDYAVSGQIGYVSSGFETVLNISNYYQKLGFFPGAHGVPTLDRVQDDGDRRNIEFPFQNVNHFKISSESTLRFNGNSLSFLLGYQNNHRQEWSEFHTHYGNNQQAPLINPDLELDFKLATYDAQVKYQHRFSKNYKWNFGVQSQIQSNKISGYNFLLPEFERTNLSAFVINNWDISPQWNLNYGIRYDFTKLKTSSFYDRYLFEFLMNNGHSESEANQFALRSTDLNKEYHNFNYSAGVLFQPDKNWDFNLNFASNFRIPTAIELGSNGIHHGSFRHEKGNPNLDPETGWTTDLKIAFHPKGWNFELNPYFYYFQNYIFLEPSGIFSPLPHGGQIYQYTQSKALITGVEFKAEKEFFEKLNGLLTLEYLYNQQINPSGDFPLPFSPPMTVFTEWNYQILQNRGFLDHLEVSANVKYTSAQKRIARNEEITDGYTLFGAGLKAGFQWNSFQPNLILTVQNLTNKKYYNHISFYRALEIPEMGRNIQLIIQIPFEK